MRGSIALANLRLRDLPKWLKSNVELGVGYMPVRFEFGVGSPDVLTLRLGNSPQPYKATDEHHSHADTTAEEVPPDHGARERRRRY